jgi:SAM-dependent methyltransferase
MKTSAYSSNFFDTIRDGARSSARVVAPIIIELIRPKSVVDVGCGDGTWLSVFREFGISDALGLDGNYVNPKQLQISQDQFIPTDLSSAFSVPRTFDLAVSLEVAEHLPSESAKAFIDSLTKLAPAILFSAAIPCQGGTQHLNEQWPEYWADLFKSHGYLPIDCIRRIIWRNQRVEWFYAQNALLFVNANQIQENSELRREYENTHVEQLALVHPKRFLQPEQPGVRGSLRLLAQAGIKAARKIPRIFSGKGEGLV